MHNYFISHWVLTLLFTQHGSRSPTLSKVRESRHHPGNWQEDTDGGARVEKLWRDAKRWMLSIERNEYFTGVSSITALLQHLSV